MEAPIPVEPGLVIASAEGKPVLLIRTRRTPRDSGQALRFAARLSGQAGSRGEPGLSGRAFGEPGECWAAGGEAGRWSEHSQEWLCRLQGRQRPYARGRGDEISSIKHYTAGVKRLSDSEQNPQVSDRERRDT
jgi:hypothetical protein